MELREAEQAIASARAEAKLYERLACEAQARVPSVRLLQARIADLEERNRKLEKAYNEIRVRYTWLDPIRNYIGRWLYAKAEKFGVRGGDYR